VPHPLADCKCVCPARRSRGAIGARNPRTARRAGRSVSHGDKNLLPKSRAWGELLPLYMGKHVPRGPRRAHIDRDASSTPLDPRGAARGRYFGASSREPMAPERRVPSFGLSGPARARSMMGSQGASWYRALHAPAGMILVDAVGDEATWSGFSRLVATGEPPQSGKEFRSTPHRAYMEGILPNSKSHVPSRMRRNFILSSTVPLRMLGSRTASRSIWA
jgi:hypothetical protein